MEKTFQRHPGASPVAPVWALPVPLLPDELVSSWLVRAALAHGCDPMTLTGWIWPGWRIWTGDPDREIAPERLNSLESISGISASAFRLSFLRPVVESATEERLETRRAWPWLLVLGARNRKRRGGLQFCPACLREGIPYYKMQWRLAWHTACEQHGTVLFDECPRCAAPVEPHRLEAGDSIRRCASCGFDLSESESHTASGASLTFQRLGDTASVSGEGKFGGERISGYEWFKLVRCFLSLSRRASARPASGTARIFERLGANIAGVSPPATGLAWEFLPAKERLALSEATVPLLEAGSEKLLEAMLAENLAASALLDRRIGAPDSLRHVLESLVQYRGRRAKPVLDRKGPCSRKVVERKFARLCRKAKNAS